MPSALRGLAPREGLEFVLVKMGRAGPPFEPRRRPQAGKSGDPRPQNTDKNNPAPEEKKKKRVASAHLEAKAPKKGKGDRRLPQARPR